MPDFVTLVRMMPAAAFRRVGCVGCGVFDRCRASVQMLGPTGCEISVEMGPAGRQRERRQRVEDSLAGEYLRTGQVASLWGRSSRYVALFLAALVGEKEDGVVLQGGKYMIRRDKAEQYADAMFRRGIVRR